MTMVGRTITGATALLIMDVQNGIVDRLAEGADTLLDAVSAARDTARAAGIAVLYVRVAFREGSPEVSAKNKSFSLIAGSSLLSEDNESTRIHDRLTPGEGEVLVTKRRVSAFAGSDLDVVLRANGVDHVVLCGIATSGVILSTTRQAADLDLQITILSDACADADPEVQRVLMEKVFPRQATVTTTGEWAQQLL